MSRTARTLLLLVTFGLLLTGVLAGAWSQLPAAPAVAHADEPTAPAPAPVAAPVDPDAAFLAALVGPGTDVSPEQATVLLELARRYCVTVVQGDVPPGAEAQTREGWIATLTAPEPSLTTGWSLQEATHFLDAATAACSPGRV